MDSAASLAELLHCYGSTHTVSGLCRWRSLLCGAVLLLRPCAPHCLGSGAARSIACRWCVPRDCVWYTRVHTTHTHTVARQLASGLDFVQTISKHRFTNRHSLDFERMFITTISIAHLQNFKNVGSYSSVDRHVYHQTNIPLAYVYALAGAMLLNQQLFSASW